MSDYSFMYIIIPLIIPFLIIYTAKIKPLESRFTDRFIYGFLWATFYVSLGFLMYKSDESKDTELFWTSFALIATSYAFLIYTRYNINYSVNLAFLMLGLSFAVLIELLFARLIDDDGVDSLERGYVHMIIPSFILVFYLLFIFSTMNVGSEPRVLSPLSDRKSFISDF